jgi:mannose-6-phosphate isomerase-like protein (cupin superfamily)
MAASRSSPWLARRVDYASGMPVEHDVTPAHSMGEEVAILTSDERKPLYVPPIVTTARRPLAEDGRHNFTVSGVQTLGQYSMVELFQTTLRGPEPHIHTREDEAWYVIEGELTFEVAGETIVAPAGAYVMAPRGIRHAYRVSKAPARYLVILSPPGLENYFAERSLLGDPSHDDTYVAARAELSRKYGMINEFTELDELPRQ